MEKTRKKDFMAGLPQTLLYSVLAAVLIYTVYENCQVIQETWSPFRQLFTALIIIGILLVTLLIARLPTLPPKTIIFVLLVAFWLRLSYACMVQTPIVSDFRGVYTAARDAVAGDFSWLERGYFVTWAYQVPYVIYEAAVLRIWNDPFAIKIANVLFMTGIVYLIYKIAGCMVSQKAALLAALLYAVYPAPIYYASVLTNQHASTFFLLLFLYLLLGKKNLLYTGCAGLAAAAGNLIRTSGTVFIAAVGVLAVLKLAAYWRSRQKLDLLFAKRLILGVISYGILTFVLSGVILLTPFGKNGLANNCPQWKIVTGLNPQSSGKYSNTDIEILKMPDSQARWKETFLRVQKNMEGHSRYSFFKKKTTEMWGSIDTAGFSIGHIDKKKPLLGAYTFERAFQDVAVLEKGIYLAVFVLAALGAVLLLLKKRTEETVFPLTALAFLGYYVIHVFIEIQQRYRYDIMPVLFIGAAFSLEMLMSSGRISLSNVQRTWKSVILKVRNKEKNI